MTNIKWGYMMNMWGISPFINLHQEGWIYGPQDEWGPAIYLIDYDKIIKYVVASGFKGIEIFPFRVRRLFESGKKFLEFIQERGIEEVVGAFQPFGRGAGNTTDRSQWDKIFSDTEVSLKFLNECDGDILNVMPGGQYCESEPVTEEKIKTAAECLNKIGQMSADYGIQTAMHNEFWCIIHSMKEIETFLKYADPDYVGYTIDTAQIIIAGNDPVELYEKYHERVKGFHFKDTRFIDTNGGYRLDNVEFPDDAKRWFSEMGTGIVDFPAMMEALKKRNYKGWIIVESDKTPNPLASILLNRWYIDIVLSKIYK